MKVLFITNIPSPYRVDFFNELGRYCQLTVAFERKSARDRDEKWQADESHSFETIFMKGKEVGADASIDLQVISIIQRGYDIIILGGYSSPTYVIAMEYMKVKRIPFIMNADGGFVKKDRKLLYAVKNHLISSPTAWLSTGKMTDAYLMHYGANEKKIYRYPFSSVKFSECVLPTEQERCEKKRLLNMAEEKVIITVGQFIPRKGIDLLIRCAPLLRYGTGLYIIGGNPSQEYYRLAKRSGGTSIYFEGFKNRNELKDFYIAADVFAFPTREDIWGLVLNEAMAYGLPCVASERAISADEMVESGINGYLVNPDNLDIMAGRLNSLLENDEMRLKMGKNAYNTAQKYTIETMAECHMNIFRKILFEWKTGTDLNGKRN